MIFLQRYTFFPNCRHNINKILQISPFVIHYLEIYQRVFYSDFDRIGCDKYIITNSDWVEGYDPRVF